MNTHNLELAAKSIPTKGSATKVISHVPLDKNKMQTKLLLKNQALMNPGPTKLLPLYEIPIATSEEVIEDGNGTCLTNAGQSFDNKWTSIEN